MIQDSVRRFQVKGAPKVTHFLAADRRRSLKRKSSGR
jgi:hypothetical protein